MKRKLIKPTAILCADIHLREDSPICRMDNFWETQWRKIKWLGDLSKKHNCPVWHAGDLGHRWKMSPYLLTMCQRHLPRRFMTVIGNHDLPEHNMENVEKSGIQNLYESGRIELFPTGHWGDVPNPDKPSWQGQITDKIYRKVLVWHHFVYTGQEPWPGCDEPEGSSILEKHPEFDLILTGDNHKPFISKQNGRLLVNAGSFTRQDADQIDYEPCVYLWYAENNTVEEVPVPIEKKVISREHLKKVEDRENRMEAFVSKVDGDWAVSVNFENNVRQLIAANKESITEGTKKIINSALF